MFLCVVDPGRAKRLSEALSQEAWIHACSQAARISAGPSSFENSHDPMHSTERWARRETWEKRRYAERGRETRRTVIWVNLRGSRVRIRTKTLTEFTIFRDRSLDGHLVHTVRFFLLCVNIFAPGRGCLKPLVSVKASGGTQNGERLASVCASTASIHLL